MRVSGKWDNFCESSLHLNSLKPKSFEPWWGQRCNACTNECILEHLYIWACAVKLGQEQSKHAGLAQHNCKICSGWWNAQKQCAHAEKSVGNIIGLLLSVSSWPHHTDWSRWFAISSSPPIYLLSQFQFYDGVVKKKKTTVVSRLSTQLEPAQFVRT